MNVDFEILVSSIGGVGSSCLFDFISKYKKTNKNHFSPYTDGSEYKHIMSPPNINIQKCIFVVGDIYESFLSLSNGNFIDNEQSINYIHVRNKRLDIKYKFDNNNFKLKNLKRDYYDTYEQINNFLTNNVSYPIMIIKYENIWDNIDKILNFLNIDINEKKNFPLKYERKSKIENNLYKNNIINIYQKSQLLINKLNDTLIIENNFVYKNFHDTKYLNGLKDIIDFIKTKNLKLKLGDFWESLKNIKILNNVKNSNKILNKEALFKNFYILNTLNNLNLKTINNILEPGSYSCPITPFICYKFNSKESFLFDLPNRPESKPLQEKLFENLDTKLNFYFGDFFKNCNEQIKDNSIDLIIDGCSVTHFCGNNGNLAWSKLKDVCDKKLKKFGYIIISSDIRYENHDDIFKNNSDQEFVYMKDILNIFKNYKIINKPLISNESYIFFNNYSGRVLHVCFQKII